jgi:hypothetical protein
MAAAPLQSTRNHICRTLSNLPSTADMVCVWCTLSTVLNHVLIRRMTAATQVLHVRSSPLVLLLSFLLRRGLAKSQSCVCPSSMR